MLKNYLKIALRNLQRNTVYSFINISGLSIGIACSMLILLWVYDEITYNAFFPGHENIHQVWVNVEFDDGIKSSVSMPLPLSDALKQADSKIKNVVVTNWGEGVLVSVGEKKINKLAKHVSENFLEVFQFDMLQGDRKTALKEPHSIILTESVAKSLFGNEDALNQIIRVDDRDEVKVTGVIADIPRNSTFNNISYFFPYSYYEETQFWVRNSKDNWDNMVCQTYVELVPGSGQSEVEANIKNIFKGHSSEENFPQVFLHPLEKWWLYSKFENGKIAGGLIEYVRLFSGIAIFILLIACINFMNLSTARSEHRAREVGIRKSVGSNRNQLINQFLGESLLISSISFLLAIVLVELSLPLYNQLVGKELSITYSNPILWMLAFAMILVTGIIAGSYPAFYLSSFKPVKVLKGKVQVGRNASTPRKVLVTLQFGFSILLIVGTIVIFQQINHLKDREVGYDRENLLMVWTNSEIEKNYATLKNELLQTSAVVSVCKSNSPITTIFANQLLEDWPGKSPDQRVMFTTIATDYDYTKTMDIKMLEGRDFSPEFKSDTAAMVINKVAAEIMGLKEPIGAKIKWSERTWEIIGVMDNVLMANPAEPINPLFMIYDPIWSSTINIRLAKSSDLNNVVKQVEALFKKYNPAYPFEYRFADQDFDKKFTSVSRIGNLVNVFAVLAIFITGLGLFGLAAFTAEQRTKEIGIRKVMGASVSSVVILLSKDFTRLVTVAFIIAAPLAWWIMDNYLERYPYRISINWWILPFTGLFALIIAVLIVSVQAIRAAVCNPVDSLRNE